MKIITLQTILKKMEDDAKGSRGCGISLLVFLAIILVVGSATISVYTIFPVLLFGGWGIGMLWAGRKQKKHMQDRAIYIVTDTCEKKHTESAGDNGDAYILTFSGGQQHTISSNDVTLTTDERPRDDEWLYNNTELGDPFYLVYVDNGKSPHYIFPQKLCQLDMTGFVNENGRLRPWKPK